MCSSIAASSSSTPSPETASVEHDRRQLTAAQGEHLPHVRPGRGRLRVVALVDGDHVGDLHDPGLERLNGVARARLEDEHDGVRQRADPDLALAGTDRLDEHDVLPGGVEKERRLQRRLGEPALVPARPHRADEHARVEEVVGEADPVAEDGSVGEWARRVDRDHARSAPIRPDLADERRDQARLSHARGARHPDDVGMARVGEEQPDELPGLGVAAFDERDRPGERARLTGADRGGELSSRHALRATAGARSTSIPRVNRTAMAAATRTVEPAMR